MAASKGKWESSYKMRRVERNEAGWKGKGKGTRRERYGMGRDGTKRNEMRQNEAGRNKMKRDEMKPDESRRNRTERNGIRRDKTRRGETRQREKERKRESKKIVCEGNRMRRCGNDIVSPKHHVAWERYIAGLSHNKKTLDEHGW